MDEPRFYRRPWFYLLSWSLILGGVYLWQVRAQGGILANLYSVLFDGCLFGAGLLVWLAFFAQFVLPVRSFSDRQKIFDRVLGSLFGTRGPAIFIENGCSRERPGERDRKGPGVLWLDSASAAVTRTATKFEQTIGPGVHFTENGETLASTVDLHKQSQRLGPREEEDPFAEKKEAQSPDEYKIIQERRLEVSGWTRDGIEVVPNISVTFKIDADPVKDLAAPGSRFGFEAEAVRKAITGEGVNPGKGEGSPRQRVAWNQLPALVAADLWREYLAKFRLGQLFEESERIVSRPVTPLGQLPSETQLVPPPVVVTGGAGTGMLRALNAALARLADRCESGGKAPVRVIPEAVEPSGGAQKDGGLKNETALQTINRMVNARMKEPFVQELDRAGNPAHSTPLQSEEFSLLTERGIRVLSVSIGGLRFPSAVEEQLVRQWSATWLDNAKAERERIERQRNITERDERVEAVGAYAESLSKYLLKMNPGHKNPRGTLKALLLRTRDVLLQDDRLRRRAGIELEELEAIVQWVERNSA
jgi:hypothetical protein